MRYTEVLLVGSAPAVKGGITSVISQIRAHNWMADNIHLSFLPTYMDGRMLRKLTYFAAALLKIRHRLRTQRPDVVYIHMSYKGSFYRKNLVHRLCRRYGIPDVLHLHGSEFSLWYDSAGKRLQCRIRRLLRECSSVIVLGKGWDLSVRQIEPAAKTLILPNTVHIPPGTVHWNDEIFQVLFLGVLIPRKGTADLLQAVQLLRDTGRLGNMRFVIAGDGPDRAALQHSAAACAPDGTVLFTGWVSGEEKNRLLQESQLLVLPSYNEGLPIAVLEALSYGMPVIACDAGDVSMAVHHGDNGFLLQPGDPAGLADALAAAAADRTRYETMSRRARSIAETAFSDSCYFKQLADCWRAAAQEARSDGG